MRFPAQNHGRRRIASTTVQLCLVSLLIQGCAYHDLNPSSRLTTQADLQASSSLAASKLSPATWPSGAWWERFGDPQLNQLIDEALKGSPSLSSAAARVRQATAMSDQYRAPLVPHVEGDISGTRQRYSENGTAGGVAGTWQNLHQASLSVGYEIDFWGKNRSALDAAIGREHAARVEQYATRLMLVSALVQAYIDLQRDHEQVKLTRHILAQQESILDLTQRRFEAELDSQIDIKQAQAALPATRSSLSALMESIELNQNKLAALLGKGPERGQKITAPELQTLDATSIPEEIPADLLARRPDIVAQRWRVEAASQDIKVAKARFYPNVNLAASVGLQSFGFGDFKDSSSRMLGLGPAINLPIFEGGRLRANLAAEDAAYDIAVEQYNQTLVEAFRDVGDQLTSLRWLKQRMAEQLQAVQTADDAFALVQARYGAGLATYIQLLTSQNQALAERRELIELQARGKSLQANLDRALGGGFSSSTTSSSLSAQPASASVADFATSNDND